MVKSSAFEFSRLLSLNTQPSTFRQLVTGHMSLVTSDMLHCAAHSEQYSRFSVGSGDNPLHGGLEEATT
jgi:hypothetical protein